MSSDEQLLPYKYYLIKLFRDCYGMTLNAYLNQVRVTWVNQQPWFTDQMLKYMAVENWVWSRPI